MNLRLFRGLWIPLVIAAYGNLAARASDDPFAGLSDSPAPTVAEAPAPSFWLDNLQFRRELNLHVNGPADDGDHTPGVRGSIGLEVQKKFSTRTSTVAALDVQGRLVWRDHWRPTRSDPMGRDAEGWTYETHNASLDLYNVIGAPGTANLRLGHGYVPFGLNAITDSHALLLQPLADADIGFERDTQALLWGSPSDEVDASMGVLAGRGEPFTIDSSTGLGAARLGLGRWFRQEHGVEGGLSFLGGMRQPPHMHSDSSLLPTVAAGANPDVTITESASEDMRIRTWRAGVDGRWTRTSHEGVWIFSAEGSAGEDDGQRVLSGLAQAEWIHPTGFWGVAAQGLARRAPADNGVQENSWTGQLVVTRHLEVDPTRSRQHFFAAGVESHWPASDESGDILWVVQYYRFW